MAAKTEIPESLKSDLPPTKWGKILAATPVVMAVIATMLAGLASSEMTKAQYDRSLGAQLQRKRATSGVIIRPKNCAAPLPITRSTCSRPRAKPIP